MERGRGRALGRARLRGLCLVAGSVLMVLAGSAQARAVGTEQAWTGAVDQAQTRAQAPLRDIPDLALVVAGDTGRTETWRSGESSFARLWTLLQPTYAGTERVSQEWEAGRHPAVRITVVWGLTGVGGWPRTNRAPGGDVAVEREDQLFVASDGTPWVRTDPAPEVADDDIRWHRAPRAVFAQMERAGVLGGTGNDSKAVGGWVWVSRASRICLVGGGGSGGRGRRHAADTPRGGRREAGPPREEPRQELIDL